MSDRAHLFTLLGPLSPGARNYLGCFIRGSGQPAAPVVMVWVPAAIVDKPDLLQELKLDTEAAEKLDHPNIIKVYGLEKLEPGWARIVEYGDAEPLRAIIEAERTREGRISPALAASMVADACTGVHFAHEAGEKSARRFPLLHGGLRPEVLMVTRDGRTKVTGYGAAAFAPQGKDASRDAYTAPEQVLGGRTAMTRQTDVYQLGAVLYEAITGFQPFTAEDGVLETCILSKMPPPRGLSAWPELGEIAMKAMAKKAADRYPTAQAMREALVSCKVTPPVSQAVVAWRVNELFPENHPDRVARRERLKEATQVTGVTFVPDPSGPPAAPPGVAAGVSPAVPVPVSVPPPPPAAAAPVAAPPPTPKASPAPAAPASGPATNRPTRPRPPIPFSEVSGPNQMPVSDATRLHRDPGMGLMLGLVGVMAIAAVSFWYFEIRPRDPYADDTDTSPPAKTEAANHPKVAANPAPMVDAGAPQPVANAAPAEPVAPNPAAAAPVVTMHVVDAGPADYALDVSTDPALQILIDGNKAGSGSATVRLKPGKHRIEGVDKSLHIDTAKEIDLRKEHQKERLEAGKAQLSFDVPAGAEVSVDGKALGKAPLDPLMLYAGTHEAVVEFNGAKTEQKVPIHADFNVTLTVHPN